MGGAGKSYGKPGKAETRSLVRCAGKLLKAGEAGEAGELRQASLGKQRKALEKNGKAATSCGKLGQSWKSQGNPRKAGEAKKSFEKKTRKASESLANLGSWGKPGELRKAMKAEEATNKNFAGTGAKPESQATTLQFVVASAVDR